MPLSPLRPALLVAAVLLLMGALPAASQQATAAGVVVGQVLDPDGAAVRGAAVSLRAVDAPDRDAVGPVLTGTDGRFRLTGAPPGRYLLRVRRIGFAPEDRPITVEPGSTRTVSISLDFQALVLEGVRVGRDRAVDRERRRFEEDVGVTARVLSGEDLRRVPGLAEADVLRAVELLPGVVTTSDFSSAYNVRGGSSDQNLVLLDGFPIFNPFHLGGVFSVFNPDAVERAELLSGGFGAEYGGRVSSVLSVESRGVDPEGVQVDGGVSLLASRATVRAPLPGPAAGLLGGSGGGVMLSARRSYFDWLLRPLVDFPYHLTDLQGRVELGTAGGGRLTATGYTGRDVFDFSETDLVGSGDDELSILRFRWQWGNRVTGLHWEQPFGDGWRLDARAGVTSFDTDIAFPDFDDLFLGSRIRQRTVRADLVRSPSERWEVRTGGEASRIRYANVAEAGGTDFSRQEDAGTLGAVYLQGRWRPDPRWVVEPGLRLDGWWGSDASRTTLSPRLAGKRFFGRAGDPTLAVRASAGRYTQFLHSLRDEELPFAIDTWVLAGRDVPPVISDQLQLGVDWYPAGPWSVSGDSYLRTFDGITDFNVGADPNDPADELLVGTGLAYGADLLVRRSGDRFEGWAAVSLLRVEHTFPDPLQVEPGGARATVSYPPIFDRRVSLDLVGSYRLPWQVEASARWTLGSSLPYSRPVAQHESWRYDIATGRYEHGPPGGADEENGERRVVVLGARNAARYPTYHRLDVAARRSFNPAWGTITPYLQVLNAYDRRDNVLFYFYRFDNDPPTRSGVSMFPFLPTVGFEVSF